MPTVVLLPGLAADGAMWSAQLDALDRLRGTRIEDVQITDAHFRCDALPAMAAALLAEHPGPLALCGASMGGIVALEACAQAPQRVQALALLGTTARPDTPEVAALRAAACALIEGGGFEEMIVGNVPFSFHPDRLHDAALVNLYLDMLRRAGAAQLVRQNIAIAARADRRPMLPSIRCPTLVLCGDADVVTTVEASREIAQSVPGAEFALVERCGHMLTIERPREVSDALCGWLSARLSARQAANSRRSR
ncbi:MAG: alpha/beta fold hydrolase [Burkholderiaceae bacterium]|nr:alpha/beta fold hydrolase [Burkholderiaceae bacterium]